MSLIPCVGVALPSCSVIDYNVRVLFPLSFNLRTTAYSAADADGEQVVQAQRSLEVPLRVLGENDVHRLGRRDARTDHAQRPRRGQRREWHGG